MYSGRPTANKILISINRLGKYKYDRNLNVISMDCRGRIFKNLSQIKRLKDVMFLRKSKLSGVALTTAVGMHEKQCFAAVKCSWARSPHG